MDPAEETAPPEAGEASGDPCTLFKSLNVSEHPAALVVSADTGCPSEQLPLTARSPDTFLEVLEGAASQSNDPEAVVEELTARNYRMPGLYIAAGSSGSLSSAGEPSLRRGMWQNFTRMTGRQEDALPREMVAPADRERAGGFFLPQPEAQQPPQPLPHRQLEQNYHMVSENLHQTHALTGIRTKVLQVSGFPQFVTKNSLKGKGVAIRPQGGRRLPDSVIQNQDTARHNASSELGSEASQRPEMRAESQGLIEGSRGSTVMDVPATVSGVRHNGITMREWLARVHKKFHNDERMIVFKQIAELIDIAHAQGLVLQNLRPSYFRILPINQVKYIGSVCPKGEMRQLDSVKNQEIGYLRGKRGLSQYSGTNIAAKQQKLGEQGQFSVWRHVFPAQLDVQGDTVGGIAADTSRAGSLESDYRDQLKLGEPYHSNMSHCPTLPSFGCQLSKSEFEKLEERWYAAPEELKEGVYSFPSNIYNLGVLLFELFCYFEAWEVHSAAMADLRHRILPPKFLLQSPKEASFCLLLLHPEPFSRPKSKDILSCGLICEGRDLSSLDRSSASINEEDAEADLLLHLLVTSKEQKEKQAAKLVAELDFLQTDLGEVEKRKLSRVKILPGARNLLSDISDICPYEGPSIVDPVYRLPLSNTNEDKLMSNIDRLQNAYFSMRSRIEPSETNNAARADKEVLKIRDKCSQMQSYADVQNESTDCLGDFFEGLCKYARYNRFEVCGSVRNVDIISSTNVICSLNFDRDEEYFAAAGVSKKIKIFEFSALLNDSVDIHYPLIEMSSRSKISCVCWNNYIKNYLASTDYDGVVQLWDASSGQAFTQYSEHRKRAWSVDFSQADPIKLASGSDDCSVKLWTINEKKCIDTIRSKANVCCVQFSPYSSQLLAFGSADYKIYCYDLRYTRIPWCTLSGHEKTVSYLKFVDSETVVSASTDNTLKLWDLNKSDAAGLSMDACTVTFSGHTNEKNFVGLSVSDGYISCGSETNEVYAYYKTLPMSITSHNFGSIDPITGKETGDDNAQFVSSVCWRGKSNMLVAANSRGTIKVLQLV